MQANSPQVERPGNKAGYEPSIARKASKWKTLKGGNRSMGTQVRKRKHGSKKKTAIGVWFLVAWLLYFDLDC